MCYNLIMNIKLMPLFSIPLMEFEYGQISEDENNIINHYLNDLRPNVYNFTTRESYILDKEKGLSNLKKFINSAIYTYVKSVIVGDEYNQHELNFKITQSWINLSVPDSLGHHEHRHSNSFISGVFYVSADASCDEISFINPLLFDRDLVLGKCRSNCFNSEEWAYPVKTGHLVLFPSYLHHYVKPLKGTKNRISLAFNVMPCGTLGISHDLNELRIQEDK